MQSTEATEITSLLKKLMGHGINFNMPKKKLLYRF